MPWMFQYNDDFQYDPQAAERGWRETSALRAAEPESPLPAVDLTDVSVLALAVAQHLMKPEVRAAFERLPSEVFDAAQLDQFELMAWALWYANTQRMSLEAAAAGGSVSEPTLKAGLELEARMMRVCEYLLIDHPTSGREVADIRSGTGHKDLAADLARLANLYQLHQELLAADGGGYYRASDAEEAQRVSGRILYELGKGQEKALRDAKADAARAFTILRRAYQHIGRWADALFGEDDYLPSLFSVRSRASSPQAEDPTNPVPEPGVTDPRVTDPSVTDPTEPA